MLFQENKIRAIIHEEMQLAFERNLENVIEKGVLKALSAFGADVLNPSELQKDFIYLRQLRKAGEESGRNIKRSIITLGLGGFGIALWEGVKILINHGGQ